MTDRLRAWWFRTDEIDARWLPLIVGGLVVYVAALAFLIGSAQ